MATQICIISASLLLLLLLLLSVAAAGGGGGVSSLTTTFDVTNYGAKTDGSDVDKALLSAWKKACASTPSSKVVIPNGTFALSKAKLEGPCNSPIELELQGTLQSPLNHNNRSIFEAWMSFMYLDQLTISGGGTFDGQGSGEWNRNTCHKSASCVLLPYNLGFYFVNNSLIRNVTTLNSKSFHVNVFGCMNITFTNFTAIAPGISPNTDGIHIAKSYRVNVTDSNFQTGDDCISIGDGVKQVGITRVTCGPGHGISVGSLGKYPNEKPVKGIYVTNCTLIQTMTGIRIKSWPNSYSGIVTDVHVQDIIMQNVSNPIFIDQEYCPRNQCSLLYPSKVKIKRASFKNIRGTSQTAVTVKLDCSSSYPCEHVEIGNIDLKYNGIHGPAKSACSNVKPISSGTQNPPLCTVKPPIAH